MALWALIVGWWRRRQRAIDMDVLWPACFDMAGGDLVRARAAFSVHVLSDRAWLELGEIEVMAFVEQLKAPE